MQVTVEQIIITANGVAYIVLWFFVRMWIGDVKKSIDLLFKKLDEKVSNSSCHMKTETLLREHAVLKGDMGEDIKRVEQLGKNHRHDKDTGEVIITR